MIMIHIKQFTLQIEVDKSIMIKKKKIIFKAKDLPETSNECTTCESCVTVCPTHIDIRKGLQLEMY